MHRAATGTIWSCRLYEGNEYDLQAPLSFSETEIASLEKNDLTVFFRRAGNEDERFRIVSCGEFGGSKMWNALRMRFVLPELNPVLIREKGQTIFAKSQIKMQPQRADVSALASKGLVQLEKDFEAKAVDNATATYRYYFESGSENDKILMNAVPTTLISSCTIPSRKNFSSHTPYCTKLSHNWYLGKARF